MEHLKIKNKWPRPKTHHTCQKPNPSHETVPLKKEKILSSVQVSWKHCLAGCLGTVGIVVIILILRVKADGQHVPFYIHVLTLLLNLMLIFHLADEKLRLFTWRYLNQLLRLSPPGRVQPVNLEENVAANTSAASASFNLGVSLTVYCVSTGLQTVQTQSTV